MTPETKHEVKYKEANTMLFNDHYQNFKSYQIPKAQLIIAD